MSKTKLSMVVLATAIISSSVTLAIQEQRSRREPQFENEHVKVWKSIILPNQPLRLHRHENGRALIALTDGSLKVINEENEQVDTYEWESGPGLLARQRPAGRTPRRFERRTRNDGSDRRGAEERNLTFGGATSPRARVAR